ncbi:MAG: hypothetical protein RMX60_04750 [Planktomarina sp.]|nr:hypothetical protein [Planktomarina sp.]
MLSSTFDAETSITISSDRPVVPYHYLPLSKKYPMGDMMPAQQNLRYEAKYCDQNVELITHTSVLEIDRDAKTVT